MRWPSNMIKDEEAIMSIMWLECRCMVLSCMDGTTLVMFCPKHGPTHIRDNLIAEEQATWIRV